LISALYTSFVALRQIVLHVIPGTGAYGDAVFGMHLYTWSFIIAMVIVVVTVFLLGVDRQYDPISNGNGKFWGKVTNLLFVLMTVIIVTNIISVVLQCGFNAECPDDPVKYELLQ
jgi:hypothetical protein